MSLIIKIAVFIWDIQNTRVRTAGLITQAPRFGSDVWRVPMELR